MSKEIQPPFKKPFSFSTAILLCLGKYSKNEALEWWICHHLSLGMDLFIAFLPDFRSEGHLKNLLRHIGKTQKLTYFESPSAESAEVSFFQQAEAKHYDSALRLALDEFLMPDLLEKSEESPEEQAEKGQNGGAGFKISYRHCSLCGQNPEMMLRFGLNPRRYCHKRTQGDFPPDQEGRFLSLLKAETALPESFKRAAILHDAAATSLSSQAQHFFNQGKLPVLDKTNLFGKAEILNAVLWQEVLRAFFLENPKLPEFLAFPPQKIKWFFLTCPEHHGDILSLSHTENDICVTPPTAGAGYSRLVLGKINSTEGFLCLLDPAPLPFLRLGKRVSRTGALYVHLCAEGEEIQIKEPFSEQFLRQNDAEIFSLLPCRSVFLPEPLQMLDFLIRLGDTALEKDSSLAFFPAPPVTALYALIERFLYASTAGAQKPVSLFSVLCALSEPRCAFSDLFQTNAFSTKEA